MLSWEMVMVILHIGKQEWRCGEVDTVKHDWILGGVLYQQAQVRLAVTNTVVTEEVEQDAQAPR